MEISSLSDKINYRARGKQAELILNVKELEPHKSFQSMIDEALLDYLPKYIKKISKITK